MSKNPETILSVRICETIAKLFLQTFERIITHTGLGKKKNEPYVVVGNSLVRGEQSADVVPDGSDDGALNHTERSFREHPACVITKAVKVNTTLADEQGA